MMWRLGRLGRMGGRGNLRDKLKKGKGNEKVLKGSFLGEVER
jgi:hypothetical protein